MVERALESHRTRALPIAILLALVALAVAAAPANAQLPDICDQYPNLPVCQAPDDADDEVPAGPTGEPGDREGGTLPFTGYPLTPLILLALLLLLLALLIRAYAEVRERWRSGAARGGADSHAST